VGQERANVNEPARRFLDITVWARPDERDTFVLCEMKVSSVAPYLDSVAPKVAEATVADVRAAVERQRPSN